MTQEEKRLLLKDLCARLPYGVICQFIWAYSNETTDGEDVIAKENDNIRCIDIHTKEIHADYYGEWVDLEHCKPCLRPMSSMTKEEFKEYHSMLIDVDNSGLMNQGLITKIVDWLDKKMFDHRNLVLKGLALEAPDGMYKTE